MAFTLSAEGDEEEAAGEEETAEVATGVGALLGLGLALGRRVSKMICAPRSASDDAEKDRSGQFSKCACTNAVSAKSKQSSKAWEPRRPARTAVVRRPAAASASASKVWIQS